MKRKLLQKLVEKSYEGATLDAKTVLQIADRLSRKELKQYLSALKRYELRQRVVVTLAHTPTVNIEKVFTELYPDKKITYQFDSSLGAGMRIQASDKEFELSLQQILAGIVSHVGSYD